MCIRDRLERIEGPSVTISNAIGVQILNNWFRETNQTNRGFGDGSAVWIEKSSNIQLEGNVIDRPGDFLDQALTASSNVTVLQDLFAFQSVDQATRVIRRGVAYRGATGISNLHIDANVRSLSPGQASSIENVSNFDRGLNRIVIDVAGLVRDDLSLDDFDFLVGNTVDPEQWQRLSDDSEIPLPTLTVIDGPTAVSYTHLTLPTNREV